MKICVSAQRTTTMTALEQFSVEVQQILNQDLFRLRSELTDEDPVHRMLYEHCYNIVVRPETIIFLPVYIDFFMELEVHIPTVYAGLLDGYEVMKSVLTDEQWSILYQSLYRMSSRIGENGLDGKGVNGRYTQALLYGFYIE